MRKILTAGAIAALMSGGLVFGSSIAAYADSSCTNPANSGPTASGLQVCTPIGTGTVSVSTSGGYLVADGVGSNPGLAGGYIGVEGNPSGVNVVGCSSGDYSTTGPDDNDNAATGGTADPAGAPEDANGNGVLLGVGTDGTITQPGVPPVGECAPTPPAIP